MLSDPGPLLKSMILDQELYPSHLAQNEILTFPPKVVGPKSLY